MRVPSRARVKKLFARPAALFAPRGPDDTRQSRASEAEQRAESLTDGAQKGSPLGEDGSPRADDFEPAFQQCRGGRRWLWRHYNFLYMDENTETQKKRPAFTPQ